MNGISHGQYLMVIVRPSVPDRLYPFTAFLGGTQIEGQGQTVVEAIEDLFTSGEACKVARALEHSRPTERA